MVVAGITYSPGCLVPSSHYTHSTERKKCPKKCLLFCIAVKCKVDRECCRRSVVVERIYHFVLTARGAAEGTSLFWGNPICCGKDLGPLLSTRVAAVGAAE